MTAILLVTLTFAGIDYSTALVSRGGDSVVAPAAPVEQPARAPGAAVSEVCRCQGYKRSQCFCLKAGVTCKCSRTSGSVWALGDDGRMHKTGAHADPRGEQSRALVRPVADQRPRITIALAPFHCPACEVLKRYDWSDFEVTYQTGGARAYPSILWDDARGKQRILSGAYKPWQVKHSWERTQ